MREVCVYAVALAAMAMLATAHKPIKDDKDKDVDIVIPTECPEVDPMDTTVHLAHENDCTKFYMCQGGKRIERICPFMDKQGNRLHFNARLQVCDWPCNAQCIVCGTRTPKYPTRPTLPTVTPPTKPTPSPTPPKTPPTPTPPKTPPTPTPTPTETTKYSPPSNDTDQPIVWKCPKHGSDETVLIPHEWDCASFYECLPGGEKELRRCSKGLLYDAKKRSCNRPELVDCERGDVTTMIPWDVCPPPEYDWITLLPHECRCDMFYQCKDGRKVGKECPEGMHFDKRRRVCDTPDKANCDLYPTKPTKPTSPTTPITIPTKPTETTTTPRPTPSPTTKTSTYPPSSTPTPNICPPDVPRTRIPHESSCSKYYQCLYGNKILRECPSGLHYHPILQVCDFPSTVKCTLEDKTTKVIITTPQESVSSLFTEKITTTTETTITTTTITTPVTETTTTRRPTYKECPPKGSRVVYLPHECSCSLFYECVDGEKLLDECPRPLHFDHIRQVCDTPGNVNCTRPVPEPDETTPTIPTTTSTTPSTTTTTTSTTPSTTTTTTPTTTPSTTTTTTTPSTVPTPKPIPKKCPPKGSDEKVYLPHECSCSLFYNCIDGEKVLDECRRGLHFDHVRQVCDLPGNVNCIRPVPDEPDETTTTETTTTETTTTESTTRSTVTEPTTVSTTIRHPWTRPKVCPPEGSNDTVYLPHECSCSLYYKCVDGDKVLDECPLGLHFDYIRDVCDYPGVVNCVRPVPDEEEGPAKPTIPPAYPTIETPIPNMCPPKGSNQITSIPHPCSCSLYFVCIDGEQVATRCRIGWHYDHIRRVCDLPSRVNCVRPIPEPTVPTTVAPTSTIPASSTIAPTSTTAATSTVASTSTSASTSTTAATSTIATATTPGKNECPAETKGHRIFLPHEHDCKSYYECVHGEKVLRQCRAGFLFNEALAACDFPENVDCTPGTPTPKVTSIRPTSSHTTARTTRTTATTTVTTPRTTSTTTTTTPRTTSTTSKTTRWSNDDTTTTVRPPGSDCPVGDTGRIIYYPHERNCSLYYRCIGGIKVPEECPRGLHFNVETGRCDYPEKAGCTETTEATTLPTTITTISSTGRPIKVFKCPPKNSQVKALLPHECLCTKYYRCEDGERVLELCPKGFHFDYVKEICDWPINARCVRPIYEDDVSTSTEKPHDWFSSESKDSFSSESKDTFSSESKDTFSSESKDSFSSESKDSFSSDSKDSGSVWAKVPFLGRYF